jgi:FdhD protein
MQSRETSRRKWAVTSQTMTCWQLADGRFKQSETGVAIEKELPIYINGRHLVTASITPAMETEFVIGYLFDQGFIDSPEDVTSLEIDGSAARVQLKDGSKFAGNSAGTSYRLVSGGGRVAYADVAGLPVIKSRQKISRQLLFRAMNTLFETAQMYRETEGVHAAGLFTTAGDLVCIVEDIGRHNTVDKVIGYALLNKVDCGNTFLVSTGRMASEMVTKVCRAGIPVAATKTAVTDKGQEISRKHGLTIIGFLRDAGTRQNTDMEIRVIDRAGMKIYTGAERVPCV